MTAWRTFANDHVKRGFRDDLHHYFRSAYEANYLRLMIYMGDIDKWEYEPQTFYFKGIKRGTTSYTPDFKFTFKGGRVEYHEVKGYDYARGRTARKRMAKYYPDVKLVLIDDDFFKSIKRSGLCKLVPNWECGQCHKCHV